MIYGTGTWGSAPYGTVTVTVVAASTGLQATFTIAVDVLGQFLQLCTALGLAVTDITAVGQEQERIVLAGQLATAVALQAQL